MPFDGSSFIRHVAERLIHEFDFSQGAGTPGLIGTAKEHPARVQLERLMPGGVAVGSGIVVDSYGGTSRQQDIVIYEKLSPVFTHNGAAEATYYPVEGVIAVGEVKSGFGKAELADAIMKSVSIKALRRHAIATDDGLGEHTVSYRIFGSSTSFVGTAAEQFDQDRRSLDQVFTFVLCQRFLASPQTTLDNFAQECRTSGAALVPNMITSLADGSIYPFNSRSGSITRAMTEGDGAIFSQDAIGGFAQLLTMLRLYVMSGRTVDRKHYERYFRPVGASAPSFTINARVML
jgi:hypothetical protein